MAEMRPSRQDMILEDREGNVLVTLVAGSYDEGYCTSHLEEPNE